MIGPINTIPHEVAAFENSLGDAQKLIETDPSAALGLAEQLVRQRNDARVYRLAAQACRRLGYQADAEAAELGAIQANLQDPALAEAARLLADGKPVEARSEANRYLSDHHEDLLAMTISAESAIALWDLESAEKLLSSVLDRAPTFLRGSLLLALCYEKQVKLRQAINVIVEALRKKPGHEQLLARWANLLASVGDNAEAVAVFEQLVARSPRRSERWHLLADHYRIAGRRNEAIAAYRKCLSITPGNGTAWWTLANYFPDAISTSDEQAIRVAASARVGSGEDGAFQLTLGLIADRRNEHRKAFDYFTAGKKSRLRNLPYDPAPISAAVDRVIATFTNDFYRSRSASGWLDTSPVFIIGMLRSGTTLVEQVLGRHSAIESTGELKIMQQLAEIIRHKANEPGDYAALLECLSDTQLAWIGERYIQASSDYRHSDKPFFIDKNNLNWMQASLILLALPNARIIDMRRNSLDCCWANFKMLFSRHFPATNNLRHVGQFYRDYVRMFDALTSIAPDRILSVRYEDVVDDIEGQTRRMLDFLGLEFEPDCLDFHLSTGAVATASSEQVRQPLNRKGIGSAEPYRQWLGPLIEELGPLAD